MTHELPLSGCTALPLAAYLKALGVLRLLGEQADPDARGRWESDLLVVQTRLDLQEFRSFWLFHYRPTPILAPWNAGSGFYPSDNKSGIEPLAHSTADRFTRYREAIETCQQALRNLGLQVRQAGSVKTTLLTLLRAEADDETLSWIDAAVLLGGDGPRYPPLLGTGGNDGRLDFTNNFMQHLVALFDMGTGRPRETAESYLDESLFARRTPGLLSAAIGQFSPGNAGGVNQGSGFNGASLVNPWDFVLMIEGATLFAAAATRRLESAAPETLSCPFTVGPSGSGTGRATVKDGSTARAEMWLPLWSAPASLRELRVLLAEGRATVGARPVRDGLDFVQAVSRLGVDRGISHFQRFAFMMRAGKAYLATPLNRVRVSRNPRVDLVDQLERNGWLSRFRQLARSDRATGRLMSLVNRLENALFLLATEPHYPALRVQQLVQVLGEAQLYLSHCPSARENCPPVPPLGADWMIEAEDGTSELAIAAALAGLHARRPRADGSTEFLLPMRAHLAPEQSGPGFDWVPDQSRGVVWGSGTLEANLVATVGRRLHEAKLLDLNDKPFEFSRVAPVAAVAAWLANALDGGRISALIPGLTLVHLDFAAVQPTGRTLPLPAAYRILKPFFCTDRQLRRAGLLEPEASLPLSLELLRLIEVGRVSEAVLLAGRRLRVAGLPIRFPQLTASSSAADPHRLIAGLMVPIADRDVRQLLAVRTSNELKTLQ